MDVPPSTQALEDMIEPFVSFKARPKYTPSYKWNDDERCTKDYIQHYDDGVEKDFEYVPVFQVLKELYDEEKNELCRSNSWSSYDESEYWEYTPYTWDKDQLSDTEPICEVESETEAIEHPKEHVVVVNDKEEVLHMSHSIKFMYT